MLPTDEPRPTAKLAAPRMPGPRRSGPPRRGPSRAQRVISFEVSFGLHFLIFLAMLGMPVAKTQDAPKVVKKEPVPIEVAFVPQPTQPVAKVAPPGPPRKPHPEPLPRAVEVPKREPVRQHAETIKPKPPKPAMRPTRVPAPKPMQRHPLPPKPSLAELLAARLNQGHKQEEQQAAALAHRNREGSQTGAETGAGVPHGDPVTSGSGLSGELASRTLLSRIDPAYPSVAERAGDEGTVTVTLYVAPSGAVENVVVKASSGRGYFDRAAVSAARRWRFQPLTDGTAVQHGDVTMTFRLR